MQQLRITIGEIIPEYKVIIEPSAILGYGSLLVFAAITGGISMFAYVLTAMWVIISHEYAHLKECLKRNVKVNYVKFAWYGGMVSADIKYANDAVPICLAGVVNTSYYAMASLILLISVNYLGRYVWTGFNFANNPYLSFINCFTLYTVMAVICNILPITYHSKKHGLISTDGWSAIRSMELRDEMWNDGVHNAMTTLQGAPLWQT